MKDKFDILCRIVGVFQSGKKALKFLRVVGRALLVYCFSPITAVAACTSTLTVHVTNPSIYDTVTLSITDGRYDVR
jgi:hypothetical protein